jgi:hypothetical protein
MINVIENHSRFTVKTSIVASGLLYPDFDKYDMTNDTAAREVLLDSLDSKLSKTVDEKTKEMKTLTFVVLWLQFIECIQVRSVRTYDMIIDRIKAHHPSQFRGQNIKALAKAFREDARVLDHAGHYDQKLTLHMLEAFLKAGGDGNEEHFLPLRLKKLELDKELIIRVHVLVEVGSLKYCMFLRKFLQMTNNFRRRCSRPLLRPEAVVPGSAKSKGPRTHESEPFGWTKSAWAMRLSGWENFAAENSRRRSEQTMASSTLVNSCQMVRQQDVLKVLCASACRRVRNSVQRLPL